MSNEPASSGPGIEQVRQQVESRHSVLGNRRRVLVAGLTASVMLIAVGFVAGRFVKSPAQVAAETAPPAPGVLTAQVARRHLASSVVLRGAVASSQSLEVTPTPAAGRAVVTGVRVTGGATVKAGQVLAEVAGRPVFVLPGTIPAYRDIRPGSLGRDVEQLQRALRDLGYRNSDSKGEFGSGTKRAVREFYDAIGFQAPDSTGDDAKALGEAQQAALQAERSVQEAREALSGVKPSDPNHKDLRRAADYAQEDLNRARRNLADIVRTSGPMVPLAEIIFVSALPARVDKVNGKVGAEISAPFLIISSGDLIVKAQVNPVDRKGLREGQAVRINAELVGLTAQGRITRLGELQKDETGKSAYQVDIETARPLPREMAGQNVRLTVETARTDSEVLVVPLSALTTNAEGITVVTVLTDNGRKQVEVAAGLSGGGFVEVKPARDGRLRDGDLVLVGE